LIDKISLAIKKKAEEEKIVYGSDMITASRYAIDNNIQLELLDRDLFEIKNLMNLIPQNEMINFMNELTEFEKKTLTEQVKEIDEEKVISELKTKYPMSYEILIYGRNVFIENKILKLLIKYPNKRILVFLGKGHTKEIGKNIDG
jgi:pheromone shutdown protein TraB